MFCPVKVTPIEIVKGKKEIIEHSPIVVDFGDYTGFDELEINGETYLAISFLDIREDSEYEIIIKESLEEMRPFLFGG